MVDFTNPDFVQFAESFGAKSYRIRQAEKLIPTLEEAFAQKVPSIVDCAVDYGENLKLTKIPERIVFCPVTGIKKKGGQRSPFLCVVGLSYKATTSYAGGDKNL